MASQQNHHPLPTPPGQHHQNVEFQQQTYQPVHAAQSRPSKPGNRPRTFSVKSENSAGTNKDALAETHNEKEAKRLHSKADPTMAMNEAEPCTF